MLSGPIPNNQPSSAAATSAAASGSLASVYGKKNPFSARVLANERLSSRQSAKDTRHIEFSLAGSGLRYMPGDALAVQPVNAPDVVADVLRAARRSGEELVEAKDGTAKPLADALAQDYDITQLTRNVLGKLASHIDDPGLVALLEDDQKDALKAYCDGRHLVDALEDFAPGGLPVDALVSLLRKLAVRLYSIASSPLAHPDEVHICVNAVRYSSHGRERKGVCSTFLSDMAAVGSNARVFIHENKNFRLPEDPGTPVIMVGPGVGIAPFRGFIEHRAATGASGENWLFMGDQHYQHDFLYQTEWQQYLADGVLTRLDTAFSRDQPEKIYVQQRIVEHGQEVFGWLERGAHFYVCGDASRMATDVHEALIHIISTHGGMDRGAAESYIDTLKSARRYQRDVY